MTIGVDIDGVIRDFNGSLYRVWKLHHPGAEVPEVTEWDLSRSYGPGVYEFAFERQAERIYSEADTFVGAEWFISELKKLPHKVIYVTSQRPHLMIPTIKWLEYRGMMLPEIMFVNDKSLARVDLLIDDAIHNLEAARSVGVPTICMARPYNVNWGGLRFETFTQIIEYLKGS